ncbi:MAG: sensor histidine kinase [Spirochaetota bacterium]
MEIPASFAHSLLDALTASIAVIDGRGFIIAVNKAWRDHAKANHPNPDLVCEGADYLGVCDSGQGPEAAQAATFAAELRAMIRGERDSSCLEYPCHSPQAQRWFCARATIFPGEGSARLVVAHEDITERIEAEAKLLASREQMRALAIRAQEAAEEERTSTARRIHDLLSQTLTRLKIDLVWLQGRFENPRETSPSKALIPRVAEMIAMADEAVVTVQRIATELRPAVLDSLGLCAALEWLARDFLEHNGIGCRAFVPAEDDLPIDQGVATAAFRIVQESLANVARHSRATEVEIHFAEEVEQLVLIIHDNGMGIDPERLKDPFSIGLAGMRERALLVGGGFDIRSRPGSGTTVEARFPRLRSDRHTEDGS